MVDDLTGTRLASLSATHQAAFGKDAAWSADDIVTFAAHGCLLATDDDEGFILLSLIADEAEVLTIAVRPEAQGAGLGHALLSTAITLARDRGAKAMFLDVASDNVAAQALYHRAGFAKTGRRKNYYMRGQRRADAFVLHLRLA